MRSPGLSRRRALGALALLTPIGLVAACTSAGDAAPDATATPSSPGLAEEVAAAEQDLVGRYDIAIAAFPALAAPLGALREEHAQHAAALSPAASPRPRATSTPVDPVPEGQNAVLSSLIAAEREAMKERIAACVAAEDAELARTLAFIGASEGSHVPALRGLRA